MTKPLLNFGYLCPVKKKLFTKNSSRKHFYLESKQESSPLDLKTFCHLACNLNQIKVINIKLGIYHHRRHRIMLLSHYSKNLDNYWTNCHEIWKAHSWFLKDVFNHFGDPLTFILVPSSVQNCISQTCNIIYVSQKMNLNASYPFLQHSYQAK